MIASTASTTTVLAVLLVVIGFVMLGTTVWLVRSTRRDAPALGPLEVMGDRRFVKATPEDRDSTLAAARPAGALPPSPMVPFDDADGPAELQPAPAAVAEAVPVVEAESVVEAEAVVEPEPDLEVDVEPVVEAEVVEAAIVVAEPDPAADPTIEAAEPAVEILDAEVVDDVDGDVDVEADLAAHLDLDERVPAPESS